MELPKLKAAFFTKGIWFSFGKLKGRRKSRFTHSSRSPPCQGAVLHRHIGGGKQAHIRIPAHRPLQLPDVIPPVKIILVGDGHIPGIRHPVSKIPVPPDPRLPLRTNIGIRYAFASLSR